MQLKALIHRIGKRCGLYIQSLGSVPWGTDQYLDIQALSGGKIDLAFDVGANAGQTVRAIKKAFPSAKIYAFEPVPQSFKRLKVATSGYRDVFCFQKAMGDQPAMAEMTASSDQRNTLLVGERPDERRVQVEVDTIDGFCAAEGIAAIDLLKIDTEGFEMHVLKGAQSMLASGNVRFVLAECDFFRRPSEPHGDFFEIAAYLSSMGYRLATTYAQGLDGDGWGWGDALFMRPADIPPAFSPYGLIRSRRYS